MKDIRFSFLACWAGVNLSNTENSILKLRELFVDGKIQAAAARRAFLPLWRALLIDAQRYNNILWAWRAYNEESQKSSGRKFVSIQGLEEDHYNWFMN